MKTVWHICIIQQAFVCLRIPRDGCNAARVIKHKEIKHVHKCDICGDEYIGDAEFEIHNNIVHHSAEVIVTEKKF